MIDINEVIKNCDLGIITKTVKGLGSDSSSDTVTFVIKTPRGVEISSGNDSFEDSSIFVKAYLKVPSTRFKIPTLRNLYESISIISDKSLKYEMDVYRDVIRVLKVNNVCLNFTTYIGGKVCPLNTFRFLDHVRETDPFYRSSYARFVKNLIFANNRVDFFVNPPSDRPSFTNTDDNLILNRNGEALMSYLVDKHIDSKLGIGMVISRSISPNTITIGDILSPALKIKDAKPLLFQIAAACYAMSLSKMTHNDLHSGNVFITPKRPPIDIVYYIEGIKYKFKTGYIVEIYDFDRAYCERMGNNVVNDECEFTSQCNEFIPNLDFIKICGYFVDCDHDAHPPARTMRELSTMERYVVDLIAKTKADIPKILDLYANGCFLNNIFDERAPMEIYTVHSKSILDTIGTFTEFVDTTGVNDDSEYVSGNIKSPDFDSITGIYRPRRIY